MARKAVRRDYQRMQIHPAAPGDAVCLCECVCPSSVSVCDDYSRYMCTELLPVGLRRPLTWYTGDTSLIMCTFIRQKQQTIQRRTEIQKTKTVK